MTDLRRRLTELRKENNITQDMLADSLDIPRSTIAAWEAGLRRPKAYQLVELAEYYDVTVDYLLGFADGKNRCICMGAHELREKINF
jgi:transcriptional regulator with XRE-family HTH domain